MSKQILIAIGLLVLSGWISGYGVSQYDNETGSFGWALIYGPGIWFGLALVFIMRNRFTSRLKGAGLWLTWSIISWFLAFRIYWFLGPIGAGAFGSAMLGLGLMYLFGVQFGRKAWILFLIGGLAGGIMYLTPSNDFGIYSAFILWQLAVGLAILLLYGRKPLKKRR